MKSRVVRVLLVLALFALALVGIVQARPAMADAPPQTSLTITKYAADGTTVENQTTVTYQWLAANLQVQGDGLTHYYTEGPTFDPNNVWDPNEICPGDSLKDKGALKGTDLKDLCDLVGGAAHGDTVQVKAADGYNDVFDAENIYTPVSRQGPIVICWWKDGLYTGTWTDGMLLAFFTTVGRASDGKLIFGHQDMHDCLPQSNWHWYYDGAIQYPSTNGMYLKWVSQVNIYSGGTTGWSFAVSGNRDDSIPQTWFENGVACGHLGATYTDSSGNIWSGMPLMYPCGIVDDTTNIHGAGAFNNALAAAGYDVKVIGSNGDNYTCRSTAVADNQYLILANTVKMVNTDDFTPLTGNQYPLKLVGPGLTPDQMVEGVSEIQLLNFPPFIEASAGVGGSISPSGDMVPISGSDQPFTITAHAGYHILDVKVDGSSIGAVGNHTLPNVTSYHTIAASFAPVWDLNNDHSCDASDVVKIGLRWGQTGTPGWVPEDLNNDGTINICDVVVVGLSWGQSW